MYHLPVSRIIVAVFIVSLLAGQTAESARADVGLPPVSPSGSSLSPEETIQTNVRMVSEEVNLTVEPYERPVPADMIQDTPGYWMRVLVDAQFVMRNLGEMMEAFDVWFPLAATTRYPDFLLYQTSQRPEIAIQDFRVHVDGQPVATQQVSGPILNLPEGESPGDLPEGGSPWAIFPVTFPPGEEVIIRVRYTLYPGGRRPFGDIEYILQTGAGWRDTIGEATIIAHLPHEITPESVSLGSQDIFGEPLEPQPAGYVVEGDTITWHFTNLEPTREDNIYLNVLEPQRYERLLQARRKVEQAQESVPARAAAAYLELARAAREAVLIIKDVTRHGGGKALGEEASSAYDRALELNPDEPSVYSEYARWLLSTGGWRELEFGATCPEKVCELVQDGLERFPQDAELLELDTLFKDSLRIHQTEAAYATQDAIPTLTLAAQETQSARPTSTPVLAAGTRTALAVATQPADQDQAALPTQTPLPAPTRILASPTSQPETSLPAQPQFSPNGTSQPSGNGGICPAGVFPLALAGLLAGMVFVRRRR